MCEFRVGDEVVCVDAGNRTGIRPNGLTKGDVYRVESIAVLHSDVCVTLFGVTAITQTGMFAADRFRKVQRRTTDLSIERFLTIKPGFEEPKRAPEKQKEKAQ